MQQILVSPTRMPILADPTPSQTLALFMDTLAASPGTEAMSNRVYTRLTTPSGRTGVMIDSILTLTKRGAFWLVVLFVVAVLLDLGVSAIVGQQEPLFLLLALAILALLLVAGVYTLGKKVIALLSRDADKPPHP
jgi:hypothetical protein